MATGQEVAHTDWPSGQFPADLALHIRMSRFCLKIQPMPECDAWNSREQASNELLLSDVTMIRRWAVLLQENNQQSGAVICVRALPPHANLFLITA